MESNPVTRGASQIIPALVATKQHILFFKRMFIGYKAFGYFGACLTSPPTPLRRRGELDSENL